MPCPIYGSFSRISAGEIDCLTGHFLTISGGSCPRLFGDHVRHSRGDLVESRLTIMMNNLDVTPDFMLGLSQMEQEVLEAPPRH
jgi:hypothetical protein